MWKSQLRSGFRRSGLLLFPQHIWVSGSSLTLAFVAGEQHQVVPHSRGVIGQCELQPELVEEGEAGQGGMRQEGRVAELATAAAEPGPGDMDGCKENTCPSVTGGDLVWTDSSRTPSQVTKRWHYCYTLHTGLPELFSFLFSYITWWPPFQTLSPPQSYFIFINSYLRWILARLHTQRYECGSIIPLIFNYELTYLQCTLALLLHFSTAMHLI